MKAIPHIHTKSEESLALWLGIAAFLFSFIVTLWVLLITPARPITFDSIKFLASSLSPIVAFGVVAATYLKKRNDQSTIDAKYWLLFLLILGVAISFFAGEISVVFMYTLSRSFRRLTLDPISATLLVSLTQGSFAYLLSILIEHYDMKKLAIFTMFFGVTGILVTGAYHYDPRWWIGSLCSLGMGVGYTGAFYVYNITVAISSLLLLLLGFYLSPILNELVSKEVLGKTNAITLKVIYLFIISQIFLVGLIPYGHTSLSSAVHNFAGNTIFYVAGLMMLLMYYLIPKQPRSFYLINYLFLVSFVASYIFFEFVQYYTRGIFEVDAIIILAVWSTYLVRYLTVQAAK